jgi:Tfp pilus assembly protein PilF
MNVASQVATAALALVASVAGAAERLRPAADDVVLTVPARISDDPIAVLERQMRGGLADARLVEELTTLYIERARQTREPRYFTRAETLLQPWIDSSAASASLLNLQADILQNRHDFAAAREALDRAVQRDPRNAGSRLLRATVNGVQGRFDEARPDCLAVLALGETVAGSACLAQVLGSTGRVAAAEALLRPLQNRESAWVLSLLADFADRRGDTAGAERHLREALTLEPYNDAARSALCDLLIERGATTEAMALLDLPNLSYGLLVRAARVQALRHDGTAISRTRQRLAELESLAARRGDVPHLREQALLALEVDRDAQRALTLAKANFATQREAIDVRLLARAALSLKDRATLADLKQWLATTGFEDHRLEAGRS